MTDVTYYSKDSIESMVAWEVLKEMGIDIASSLGALGSLLEAHVARFNAIIDAIPPDVLATIEWGNNMSQYRKQVIQDVRSRIQVLPE